MDNLSCQTPQAMGCMVQFSGMCELAIHDKPFFQAGGQPTERRRKWRQLEARISRLKDQYANGTLTMDQYWDAIRFAVLTVEAAFHYWP